LVDSGGSLEASMVFEKLFTDYLKGQENDSMRSILLKRLERMRVEQPILKGIQIGDDGRVFINMREGSESRIVTILSGAFDSLMELAAYSIGQEKAFRDAETVVFAVMKQFNEPFLRLGIKDSILKGSMSDKLSSGVDGFDSILGGGLPRSDMILLTGPPGAAKYHFAFQFLAEGLKNGRPRSSFDYEYQGDEGAAFEAEHQRALMRGKGPAENRGLVFSEKQADSRVGGARPRAGAVQGHCKS
jgi:hypothetical protein